MSRLLLGTLLALCFATGALAQPGGVTPGPQPTPLPTGLLTTTGALKGNGSGAVSQAACADLSNAAASCATDATNAANISAGSLPAARLAGMSNTSNALSGSVTLTTQSTFYDGPSMAQGTAGTWFVSGQATIQFTASAQQVACKLWDGTTIIAQGAENNGTGVGANYLVMTLSGVLATPAGNVRISCEDTSSASGAAIYGASYSSVWGLRIG